MQPAPPTKSGASPTSDAGAIPAGAVSARFARGTQDKRGGNLYGS